MRWASTLSRRPDAAAAFSEGAAALEERLGGERPDLVLLFASPHHAQDLDAVAGLASSRFPGALVAGCTGSGIIGAGREVEGGPALSLTGAVMPGVALAGLHVGPEELPDPESGAVDWHARLGVAPRARPKFLLLADPYTIDAAALVRGLDRAYPGAPKAGGLASGGGAPGDERILVGGSVHPSGAAVVTLSGDVEMETIVAQGCRPIGRPMLVTRCRGGLLLEVDRGAPLEVLAGLFDELDARDRDLVRHSLLLGVDLREERVEYDPDELLVRNIVGVDEASGAIAVGENLRPVQAVQFVVRDARAADEDLRRRLSARGRSAAPPAGALLFSCTGRGSGLFGHPDHDTGLFADRYGTAALGGLFCSGEIGPVGGRTHIHGYTSAFALFRNAGGRSRAPLKAVEPYTP